MQISIPTIIMILFAAMAHAQTKDRLDRREKLFGFEAVGLLEGPKGQCTAALIARDVLVTAAHCVHGKPGEYTFRAAFSDGAALATRRVEDMVIAKGYIEASATNDRAGEVENDVALARLASPVYDAGIDPYAIADAPDTGAALTLASYGRGRMGALTLERGCRLRSRYRGGVVQIDCDATFGSSGAPVFTIVNGRPQVFSIVSSGVTTGADGDQTLGVELAQMVPQLLKELSNRRSLAPAIAGARRTKVGEPLGSSGARFIRPNGS